ncbi:MAG: metal-binding protein [Deltaproteobacteria bacterium]|nr:metal-binding protein [Deltaproteobacteria bacterium]
MASGKVHNRINLSGTVLVLPLLYFYTSLSEPEILAFGGGAVFGSCFLSPDLDLKQSNSQRAWGGFRWLWYGYHRMFAHRKLSHMIVLGTLSRLLWLGLMAFLSLFSINLLYWLFQQPDLRGILQAQVVTGELIREGTFWLHSNQPLAAGFFCGLIFSDTLHLISDLLFSLARKWSLIR